MDKVTDQLWITEIPKVHEESTVHFDRVVTVCENSVADNVSCAYDHIKLADGPYSVDTYGESDASYKTFARGADAVLHALRDGEKVLVHCHAGVSRAPSVSIAALGVHKGITYEDAFGIVSDARLQTNPISVLRKHAYDYIRNNQ